MTQVVTELIVRGDGALGTLGQFEDKMQAAGAATDVTTGAVADFERRMATARQAIERGNAITTQSIERKTAEQRAWDRWSATVDKAQALRIRLEREAQQASVAAANAVNLGYTSQEKALSTLIALEQRHAAQLRAVADSHQTTAVAAMTAAAANDNLAMSANRVAAANDNARFSSANVAAQFQDVAVTAAMGMNPIMIALQQGTQLSSVLMTMKNPIAGLGTALVSILNPVSLLTIGFVALSAAAIQFFMGANDNAKAAADALKEHDAWLDDLLFGYAKVREAAQTAAEAAARMPEGVVRSDLEASLREQKAAEVELQLRIDSNREALASLAADLLEIQEAARSAGETGAGLDEGIRQIEMMRQLAIDTSSTRGELDAAMVAARNFINTVDNDPALKELAQQAYNLGLELMAIRENADAAGAALRALPHDIQIKLQVSQEFGSSLSGLQDLYADPRSKYDIDREQAQNHMDQLTATAQSYGALVGAASEYERVLASIDAAEAAAAEKKASSAGKTDTEKAGDNYADLIRGSREYAEAKILEAETLSMAADVAARMRNEQDLMNQAANDNIALSPAQREEIYALAEAMAEADLMLAGAQMRLENRSPWENAAAEIANLDAMVRVGAISWDEYGQAAGRAMASAANDTLGSMSQISGALASAFEGNKAFAIANAVINTAEGVTKALAQGGMWSFPIAAAIAAAGAAQIATIMSASPGGGATAARAPSAAPAAQNAQQRQKTERAPDRMDITLHGLDRNAMYSGENIESFLKAIEERAADGRILKIKVA